MDAIFTVENLVAFLTLAGLEIVLGIDNIVFVSILSGKLPPQDQPKARRLGLIGAMVMRVLLLLSISWVMGLTQPLLTVSSKAFSGRDLILLVGGLFLIAKSTHEIHTKLEGEDHGATDSKVRPSMKAIVTQIMLLDVVFSLDSVITAVGMAKSVVIMIAAVIASMLVMLASSGAISAFIERHPTTKILALSFLLLIGVMLLVEGFGGHVEKGYIYAAMAFSLFVEILNIRISAKKKTAPLHLKSPIG